MCGIAGVIGTGPAVGPMIEALKHRGPNGVRVEAGAGWALGHARLSIIDLEGGWQPLHADGSTIIGNGENYNYLELTRDFALEGRLSTGSDFEPVLRLYGDQGRAAFNLPRGMYASCLLGGDKRDWLMRDPFGIKPLYLHQTPDALMFASEPRALFAGGAPRAMNPRAAEELLALNYTLRPPYLGVRRLKPGAVEEITPGAGRLRAQSDVDWLSPAKPALPRGETELLDRLDAVLEDSVSVHQRADVPYGLFLSGGIDSAAIATLMARLNQRPVTAYTCGFDAPGAKDERGQAERVARALDLDWRETTFDEEDFWRIAPEVAWALDDPTTDYATLPTYKLAEAAKGTLTVVLSGEGGDELFAGYGRYRRALRPAWLGGRAAEPRVKAPFLKDGGAGALAAWRASAHDAARQGFSPLKKAQAADIATWLPNDLLLKLDRCLMAHGLEGRTPFLDREVAAFAFNLPDRMKVRGRYGKWLLRKWLERACPAAEPWARKQGFTVPVAAWIAPRAADLGPRLAALKAVREVCIPEAVEAAFKDDAQAAQRWPLLFFGLWSLIHLEDAEPKAALASLLAQ
jgi:asparagine synthase (glutamine-hydrolysing)